jgi:hypothetical protein
MNLDRVEKIAEAVLSRVGRKEPAALELWSALSAIL